MKFNLMRNRRKFLQLSGFSFFAVIISSWFPFANKIPKRLHTRDIKINAHPEAVKRIK